MSLVDYPLFSWVVVIHSTCFELSESSSSGDPDRAEHVGEREGYSKDYTLYQRLTVQGK